MTAKPTTSAAILGVLRAAPCPGPVASAEIAAATGLPRSTVQRWGRERGGISDGARRIAYHRGTFTISELQPDLPEAPDWFAHPDKLGPAVRRDWGGSIQRLARNLVSECFAGSIALAPWQRPAVWSESQQIDLLTSMMGGIPIGTITAWEPPCSVADARAFPCCPVVARPLLIVDGQQRITTLVKAALGQLDHWRWDGQRWHRGQGFLTPRLAVRGAYGEDHDLWSTLIGSLGRTQAKRAWRHKHAIECYEVRMLALRGTAAEMVQAYRLLASKGSPHSLTDLAFMESWLAEQGLA